MTNRFFSNPFNAPLFSLGRSVSIKAALNAVQSAFDALQQELDSLGTRGRKFEDLNNVPASLSGKAMQYLRANVGATALEFVPAGRVAIISLSGASNTLLASHAGCQLLVSHTTDSVLTIQTNAVQTFGQGDVVLINQRGAGQVVISPAGGVTVRSTDGLMRTRTQHANVALEYLGGDEWLLIGERDAPGLAYASLAGANIFTKAQSVTPVALTDGVSIATDASLSNNFTVTLAGNRALANPTNLTNGVILNWKIKQDATGNRTLTYGNKFKWAGGTAPSLSTAANARDFITAQYFADEDILVASMLKGVA